MTYWPLHSSHTNEDIILNMKPQIIRFIQDKRRKQTPKHRLHTYHQFSFVSLNDLKSQKLISTLNHLKSLKRLTIDLVDLLQTPERYVQRIFDNLRHVKNLSVLHFQLKDLSFPLHEKNLQSFSKALKEINKLLKVQIRLSVNVPITGNSERERVVVLIETLRKLDRFAFLSLAFSSFQDFTPIQETILILKASKSLNRLSLTLEKCELCPCVRLHELFLILKDIKPLRCLELFIKECDLPYYNRLKSIFPYLEELGQNQNISITFEDYKLEMTKSEQLSFTKSVKNIRSPHKIQVQFIENYTIARELKSSCSRFISGIGKALDAWTGKVMLFIILSGIIIAIVVAITLKVKASHDSYY